jgi:hypothetical protein
MSPVNAAAGSASFARTWIENQPSLSVQTLMGRQPASQASARKASAAYLQLFSQWIVSPSAKSNEQPATDTR